MNRTVEGTRRQFKKRGHVLVSDRFVTGPYKRMKSVNASGRSYLKTGVRPESRRSSY